MALHRGGRSNRWLGHHRILHPPRLSSEQQALHGAGTPARHQAPRGLILSHAYRRHPRALACRRPEAGSQQLEAMGICRRLHGHRWLLNSLLLLPDAGQRSGIQHHRIPIYDDPDLPSGLRLHGNYRILYGPPPQLPRFGPWLLDECLYALRYHYLCCCKFLSPLEGVTGGAST